MRAGQDSIETDWTPPFDQPACLRSRKCKTVKPNDARTRRLLGYVELGMEINKILENVHNLFGVDIFVLIKKEFVRRNSPEEGMRVLGRTPDWERFPDAVLSTQAQHELSAALVEQLKHINFGSASSSMEMSCSGHPCRVILLPLFDVAGDRILKGLAHVLEQTVRRNVDPDISRHAPLYLLYPLSSVSRTLRRRSAFRKGFARNSTSLSRTPFPCMMSAV